MLKNTSLIWPIMMMCFLMYQSHCYAHEGRPVYIEIQKIENSRINMRWKIPPVMQAGSEPVIRLQTESCEPESPFTGASLSGGRQYQCTEEASLRVVLDYPNNNPSLSSLIHFIKEDGQSISLFNGPDTLQISLPEKMQILDVVRQYIHAGFTHILKGFDHLLFVLCLMQIAVGMKKILLTVTGFTLAHSLTLVLASLGILHVRTDVVEVLIALSIVMLIVEIFKVRKGRSATSLAWQYPVLVAAFLGLLHGLGFASALTGLGLPQNLKFTALAFFNVGVELGQLLFIVLVLWMVRLVKKITPRVFAKKRFGPASVSVSFSVMFIYLLGSISSYWLIERSINLMT